MIGHSAAKSGSIPGGDLSALIARLETAVGGSQALTDDTLKALGFVTKRYPMDSDSYWIVPGDERHPLPPWCDKITVSHDAALALAERVLGPGAAVSTFMRPGCRSLGSVLPGDGRSLYSNGEAATVPMAICIAILRAIHHGYEAEGVVSPNLNPKAQGEVG